jgi:8-oxo-dGTP diphosphatase
MANVRISVKAIITKHGCVLAVKSRDPAGEWYMLPGGGQEHGETIPDALNRECLEEIGSEVTIGRLRFVRDYIAKHHEFAGTDGGAHQVELMFECQLTSAPVLGPAPDAMQKGIEWLELSRLADYRLYPSALRRLLAPNALPDEAVYLGDVN